MISALHPAPGVFDHIVYTDLDEGTNTFIIAVDSEGARGAATREIAKLDVPADAFRVIVRPTVAPD